MTTVTAPNTVDAAPTPKRRPVRRRQLPPSEIAESIALPVILVGLCVYFSVAPQSSKIFPTSANWQAILGNQAVIAIVAFAAMVPLVCGYFDFSVGASTALSSVLSAGLMSRDGWPLAWAIAAAVAASVMVAALNAFLVAYHGMNPFVTTLGVATLLSGVISWYTDGQSIYTGISPDLTAFGSGVHLGVPNVAWTVIAVAAVLWYMMAQTPFGRRLAAIGSNPRSARLVGIRVERNVLGALLVSGVLAGLAGVLQVSRIGGATSDSGTSLLFPALTAVFLGATTIKPGRFNVVGTLVGVLLVAVSVSGLTLSGVDDWVNSVFNGSALIVAITVSTYLSRRRGVARS